MGLFMSARVTNGMTISNELRGCKLVANDRIIEEMRILGITTTSGQVSKDLEHRIKKVIRPQIMRNKYLRTN